MRSCGSVPIMPLPARLRVWRLGMLNKQEGMPPTNGLSSRYADPPLLPTSENSLGKFERAMLDLQAGLDCSPSKAKLWSELEVQISSDKLPTMQLLTAAKDNRVWRAPKM